MRLPEELADRVAQIGTRVPAADLKRAAKRLSDEYRGGNSAKALSGEAERVAYLIVRMPATYAAVRSALTAAKESLPQYEPARLADLGSGSGTGLWAACDVFPSLQKLESIERDLGLESLGRELAGASQSSAIRESEWLRGDLRSWKPDGEYDLVIGSYALGELPAAERKRVLLRAWDACSGALAVIEPGTRRGFEAIAEMRDWVISAGATLAAPCPHALECPMRSAGDWCHFAARVERTAEHRRLKEGELGYEDEKFSYIVACKMAVQAPGARIVRHPKRFSGFTQLTLCTSGGLKEETVTRTKKEKYREAKKVEWGEGWERIDD